MDDPLLSVRGLTVQFTSGGRVSRALDGVDLEIRAGETVGLVGETGCGKSATALAVMGLIPSPPGRVVAGQVFFEREDLLTKTGAELRRLRGAGISMIFQEPMTSLDPSFTIGSQLAEVLEAHRGLAGRAGRQAALALLEDVRLPHPERVLGQYPFQLSGGMRQRVMIALATASQPRLLLADEPTTALDVTTQAQILALLTRLNKEHKMGMLLVSHDFGVIAQVCDRVAVMYGGYIVETAPVEAIYHGAEHPYTRGLLESIPRIESAGHPTRLPLIRGLPPDPTEPPPGCVFEPRCPYTKPTCSAISMTLEPVGPAHATACPVRPFAPASDEQATGAGAQA